MGKGLRRGFRYHNSRCSCLGVGQGMGSHGMLSLLLYTPSQNLVALSYRKLSHTVHIIGPRPRPVGKPFLQGFKGRILACFSQLILAAHVPSLCSRGLFHLCSPLLSPKDFRGFNTYGGGGGGSSKMISV